MMKYIEFPNRKAAEARSKAEMKKSSGYRIDNVTQFRWGIEVNEDNGDVVMAIPANELGRLNAAENSKAIDKAALQAKHPGWFKTERAQGQGQGSP